ncbi:DUF1015 family protein [Sinosporangium siamense]|uniref:DUF1015 domain-containing protein n=1 Tax=Sinosporangium siamense TaxID=1367973 RepID=A0A919RMM8_9ACTN|nr:DUF1015 domain-containing protein [Sinosporangium siamense]GII96577.1 hypothetical protein Ssi02_68080 [Sinosporangium siamense]
MASPELPVPDGLVLHPFRGVRYVLDDPAKVISPPYDLVSDQDVLDLLSLHPNNVVRLILPGADHHRYGEARDTLQAWLTSGLLAVDDHPALYVYEQAAPNGTQPDPQVIQRGLIGNVALADPEERIVLPHENVMPGPVADRLALMNTTEANLEPIFLLYDGGGPASHLVDAVAANRPPLVEATTSDGIRHGLWAVVEQHEHDLIGADLRPRQALIADGHHRYATYRALQHERHQAGMGTGPWDSGLALLVDSSLYPPDLKPIHRVIPDLPLKEAVAKAKGAWQVHEFSSLDEGLETLHSTPGPAFLLAGDGSSHLLTNPDPLQIEHGMPPDRTAGWKALNTSIFNEFLLPKVWGMHDDEQAVRIVHHDPYTAEKLAATTDGTAVVLQPLATGAVLAVAAEGEQVPRKSTSFGPKPRTGLVMRTFATG